MRRPLLAGLVSIAVLAIALVVVGINVILLVTSDHLDFGEDDLAYHIIVTSETVKNLPRFKPDQERVSFVYSARDGTAPEQITMLYRSEVPPEDLVRRYRTHCQDHGFAEYESDFTPVPTQLACAADDYQIEFAIFGKDGETDVSVFFVGR